MQAANIIMEDESGDSDEVESDFSEEDIVGSEDQFSDGSSSESSSSGDENTANESAADNIVSSADEVQKEDDLQMVLTEVPPLAKQARLRGGLRPNGLRLARGGCNSSQQPSIPVNTDDSAEPQKRLSKAEQKKKERELMQALWKDEPNKVSEFSFDEEPGLKINMNSKKKIDFFKLFLTDELLDLMVSETNKYAEQEIDRLRPLRRKSRYSLWKPVDNQEMRKFLGILLLIGIVRLPTIEHYLS